MGYVGIKHNTDCNWPAIFGGGQKSFEVKSDLVRTIAQEEVLGRFNI